MSTAILLREAEWLCMDNCQDHAARIRIAKGISARHLGRASSGTPQRHPPAATPPLGGARMRPARSALESGGARHRAAGRGRAGWGRGEPLEVPRGEKASGKAWGKLEGQSSNGIVTSRVSRTQETHRRCTHVAPETTRDVVGIRRPNQTFLGVNGRGQWEVGRRPACDDAGGA